ncbi:uncharacterized protein KY384_002115 [Bacidia gigantensis]|uniref:uncharacterized protein n=1 Tax=Bacidia gigantensis TaxID=2732470 RepID=UPI001D045118|nr:uncharacterized protein KY384_002115 [Bacidia gigantensis]KAG8533332.1 hypothetical protein KY384_002115 [Bacidia gigantensis]
MTEVGSDPFVDPVHLSEDRPNAEGSTLAVGRNASLTLATESLIVLGSKTTLVVPFFNILWAETSGHYVTIQYAKPTSKNVVRVVSIHYLVDKPQDDHVISWVSRLLNRAYGVSQKNKKIKVLVNPFGGQGKAQKWFLRDIEPIFAAAKCELNVERTLYRGHAVEIAEKLDVDSFDVVACCSGDGLPHEVFNGLGKKSDASQALSTIAVVQLPCGTGNAMSLNLFGTDSTSVAALCVVKGIRTPLDLTSVTQGDTRTLSFLSQSVGIVAEVDLGTEHLRWMGSARFTYGFLVRIIRKTVWPCEVAVKLDIATKSEIKAHYGRFLSQSPLRPLSRSLDRVAGSSLPPLLHGDVKSSMPTNFTPIPAHKLGNFYAGNMALMAPGANFFPAALPSDGYLDLITIDGDIGRLAAIQSFLAVENGKFFDMPHVGYRKISGYRIKPLGGSEGYISIDGERVPFEEFQAEVHRGLGRTLSRTARGYEVDGVLPRPDLV